MEMGLFGLLAAPISSLLGEYTSRKMLMVVGCIACGLAIVGLGSANDAGMASGFACILGIGLSTIATPALPAMLWDVPEDSLLTDGEVARITNALGALAAVIGPIWGAGLAEKITFKGMSMVTGGVLWLFAAAQMLLFMAGALDYKNKDPHMQEVGGGDDQASAKPLLQRQTDVVQDRSKKDEEGVEGGWFGMGQPATA